MIEFKSLTFSDIEALFQEFITNEKPCKMLADLL